MDERKKIEQKDVVNELTVDNAKKLLFFSFQFSQGNAGLQEQIFDWLHKNFPEYKIDPDKKQQIFEQTLNVLKKFFFQKNQSYHITSTGPNEVPLVEESILESLKVELDQMEKTFNKSPLDAYTYLTSTMLEKMVVADEKFLLLQNGRKRKDVEDKKSSLADPNLSFVCKFILNRSSTGIPEYDMMFTELSDLLRKRIETGIWSRTNKEVLFLIIDQYNENHPEDKVILNVP